MRLKMGIRIAFGRCLLPEKDAAAEGNRNVMHENGIAVK